MPTQIRSYKFTLILSGIRELTDDMCDALFDAECNDALPGMTDGVAFLDFTREGKSFQDAYLSAIKAVERALVGVRVVRVDTDEPDSGIRPTRVRYIKLGARGKWEKECLENGIIRFGFGTSERFPLCQGNRWEDLRNSFLAEKDDQGRATRFTNETRLFFTDDGSTLWITFVGKRLYWGFLEPTAAERHPDGDGVQRTVKGGWRCTDLKGEPLTTDRLSGALTKLASYQGTSCSVDVATYTVRRISGDRPPEVEHALGIFEGAKSSIQELMTLLEWRDFEVLVDLVFSTSGWRRLGELGKTQKGLDLDLVLPSTGEQAFVQVKARATSAVLAAYVDIIDELGPYDRMFFVYHTGEAYTEDERVTVIGPEKLAEMVLDAGLANWLIRKVS